MARYYKVELKRDGVESQLYIHDDETIEIVSPDDSVAADYLIRKLKVLKEIYSLGKQYNIDKLEVNKV